MARPTSTRTGSKGGRACKPSEDANDDVAVLYLKQRTLKKVDKNIVEEQGTIEMDLPRLHRIVYIPSPDAEVGHIRATVDLWHLGIGYNMNRMLGNSKKLYVVSR
ncbi:hypothetical protein GGR52DRAFT_561010 [Hypoxylon sp. FL1284]|nr:hypothetical protein GGR52DRAFT_561010 [Hypoxylon sp. FL1284]